MGLFRKNLKRIANRRDVTIRNFSCVIPAPHHVRGKLQRESSQIVPWKGIRPLIENAATDVRIIERRRLVPRMREAISPLLTNGRSFFSHCDPATAGAAISPFLTNGRSLFQSLRSRNCGSGNLSPPY
jgi:hypothetical protein